MMDSKGHEQEVSSFIAPALWCLDSVCECSVSYRPQNTLQNHYLCNSHLLDTNHLINIRFLGGKEFRCYLNSKTFSSKKRKKKISIPISFLNPSEKYLEIKQVGNMWVLRWNFLLFLVQAANSIFAINLTLDGHEETYFSSLQETVQENWGQISPLF